MRVPVAFAWAALCCCCLVAPSIAKPAAKRLEKKSIAEAKAIEPVDQKLHEPAKLAEADAPLLDKAAEEAGETVDRAKKHAGSTTFCVEIRQNKPTQVDCDENKPPPPPPAPEPMPEVEVPCEPEIGAFYYQPAGEILYAPTGNCVPHSSGGLVYPPSASLQPQPQPNYGLFSAPVAPAVPAIPSVPAVPAVPSVPAVGPSILPLGPTPPKYPMPRPPCPQHHQHLPGFTCTCGYGTVFGSGFGGAVGRSDDSAAPPPTIQIQPSPANEQPQPAPQPEVPITQPISLQPQPIVDARTRRPQQPPVIPMISNFQQQNQVTYQAQPAFGHAHIGLPVAGGAASMGAGVGMGGLSAGYSGYSNLPMGMVPIGPAMPIGQNAPFTGYSGASAVMPPVRGADCLHDGFSNGQHVQGLRLSRGPGEPETGAAAREAAAAAKQQQQQQEPIEQLEEAQKTAEIIELMKRASEQNNNEDKNSRIARFLMEKNEASNDIDE